MKYIYLLKKYKNYLIVASLIIIIIIGYIWANKVTAKYEEKEPVIIENPNETIKEDSVKIKVDIKGEVKNPNVYELIEGSRVIDLINKAGGLTKGANTDNINLSKKLKDQNVIIIYSNDEINAFKEIENSKYSVKIEPVKCPDVINSGCINNESKQEDTTVKDNENKEENSNEEDSKVDEKININEATKDELTSLTGIGESKALAIISYREENGPFLQIEDIKNVTGIGDSIYEKIKDNITL